MPHYNAKPLLIVLQPSYRLAGLITFAALSSGLIILMAPLAFWLRLTGFGLIVLTAIYTIYQHALLRLPRSWMQLKLNVAGEMTLTSRDGTESEVLILPSSFVASYLMVLNIRAVNSHRARHVLLLPDSSGHESLRRLRVWLLWGLPNHQLGQQETQSGEL